MRRLSQQFDFPFLHYPGVLPADEHIFQAMVAAGIQVEGVMAKRKLSPYRPGVRSDDWLKIKRPGWQEGRTRKR